MSPPDPPLLNGHSYPVVLRVLKEARWNSRHAAKVVGVSYRALDHYRRDHSLYAHTHRAPHQPLDPEAPLPSSSPQALPEAPPPQALESISAWATRQGFPYEKIRYLRDQNRLAPLYRYATEGEKTTDYATPDTQILTAGKSHALLPLEGHYSLSLLMRDEPALAALARRLITAGQLHPLSGAQRLINEAQLAWLRTQQQGAKTMASTSTNSRAAKTVLPQLKTPTRAKFAPDPARWDQALRMQTSKATDSSVPYVPQPGYISVPRFELRWRAGTQCTVLDRGERGEHVRQPITLAEFYSEMVYAVFPVVDEIHDLLADAPTVNLPQNPPQNLPAAFAATVQSAHSDAVSAQIPAALKETVQPTVSGNDATLEPAAEPAAEPGAELAAEPESDSLQESLEEELARTREQLEWAQRKLELAQNRSESTPLGKRRLPDRRLQVHEATRIECDRLQQRVNDLEEENRRQLEDLLRLEKSHSRKSHFEHVQHRLRERYGLKYSFEQVEQLDQQVRNLPLVGVGKRGQQFKRIQIGEHTLYPLIVRDSEGDECIGTVYLPDMFERAQWRKSNSS